MKNESIKQYNINDKLVYNYVNAAYLLDMSPQALRSAVSRGTGPRPSYRGKRVYFTRKDLDNYIKSFN